MSKKVEVGDKYKTSRGDDYTILNYNSCNDIEILIHGYEKDVLMTVTASQVRKGYIKNPYNKSLCGVGYMGVGKFKSKGLNDKSTREYSVWNSMIMRCYSENGNINEGYEDCTVHPDWHNFQVFAEWFTKHPSFKYEGWHLDKDILIKGNKVYSEDTCCLVPCSVNNLFIKSNGSRGDLPVGVVKSGKKFMTQLGLAGDRIHLGTYTTAMEAFIVYKRAKEAYIKYVADVLYATQLEENVKEAMRNYEVDITD